MNKTFTIIFLVCSSILYLPKLSNATNLIEISSTDTKYGDKDIIKFYPNPMVSDATIKINEDVDLEKNKVSILFYNMVGSEVFKISTIKDYEQKISREFFKNTGMYFYQLKIDEKIITTGRITVK